jgi:putative ABC transport system permease protein
LRFLAFVLLAGVETSLDGNIARRVPARAPDYFVLTSPAREGDLHTRDRNCAGGNGAYGPGALRGSILAYGPADHITRVADLKAIPDDAWALRGDRGLTYADSIPEGNVITGRPLVAARAMPGRRSSRSMKASPIRSACIWATG